MFPRKNQNKHPIVYNAGKKSGILFHHFNFQKLCLDSPGQLSSFVGFWWGFWWAFDWLLVRLIGNYIIVV